MKNASQQAGVFYGETSALRLVGQVSLGAAEKVIEIKGMHSAQDASTPFSHSDAPQMSSRPLK
ncbi:hypothetical protein, partial [Stutzerimonas kunmingensis]|uniref:hypothetical protein n=1 Tax=Stutzerimonas kunmingensis TaxID=1211807 RepID=UPI00242FBCA2